MTAPPMSEADLQTAVTDLCAALGLRWWHDNDSRRNRAGLPDLIIVGPGGLAFIELKRDGGRLRPEQRDWLEALRAAGATAGVWWPADLHNGRIAQTLQALARPA